MIFHVDVTAAPAGYTGKVAATVNPWTFPGSTPYPGVSAKVGDTVRGGLWQLQGSCIML